MKKEKLIKYGSITLRIIIAINFLLAGSGKFQTESIMASNFKNWGLGIGMMFLVGVFEVLGALFLLFPKTILYGSYMLIIVMLGAFVIHLLNLEELGYPITNVILIAFLLLIIYLNRKLKKNEYLV